MTALVPPSKRPAVCSWMVVAALALAGLLPAADLPVTSGLTDKTSSDYTLDVGTGTLALRDPAHRWIWFTHVTRPGEYTVSAKVAVAQPNAGATLRVGHWDPRNGEASSAETTLASTDPTADLNPQWQILGTIRIPTPGDHTLFARMLSQPGPGPGLLHAIRLEGPGTVSSASSWEARTSACDPGTTGAGSLRRSRYTEVIPRPWPLPAIGGTFTTCQAPGGYLGCQEGFFWSSWENGGVFPDILVAFGGTRAYNHEGSGRTISLEDFSLPLDRRRQTLVLHKPDGLGTNLATVLVGEAGQGWHLLGRMRRPAGGTTVSSTLGFLENPGTFNSNLHRRSSAWGNPWFFGEETSGAPHTWWPAAQLKAHLRGPSPTDTPPLPKATYPWGSTRLRQDLMEMTIGGQIPIAQNDTFFPTPAATLPALPTLNLAYHLAPESHVHQALDANVGTSYSSTITTLIRDPFSTLDFEFSKDTGPSWISVATDGSLTGTPPTAGQHIVTLTATDPEAGLSGSFTIGIYAKDSSNNPPAFLDHPATLQIAATIDGADLLPLRFHDPDPGDSHTLAITAGNTGNTFTIDQARGMLVKNTAPATNSTWNLTITVTDNGSPAGSDTQNLTVTSGPSDQTGGAFRENWFVIDGNTVADLTGNARFPDTPDQASLLGALEDDATGKNTGTRVRGWLHPPTTGNYTFWVSGDDAAEFHLGTDDTPASGVKRCESTSATKFRVYDSNPEQQSAAIPLIAGQRYYLEVLAKRAGASGGTAGSFSVAWDGPGFSREPVAAEFLSPFRHLAPAFPSEPITLRPVLAGESYRELLQPKLSTLHLHPAITYTITSGPSWLAVAPDGTLTGIPAPSDAGTNTATIRATTAGGLFDEATFHIEVSANTPPLFTTPLVVLPAIDESEALHTSIAPFATDADLGNHFGSGDQLAFTLINAPAWLHIDPAGTLFGTPSADDIGLNTFTIVATDLAGLSSQVPAEITVNDIAIPPAFVTDPIPLNAIPGIAFAASLTPHAYDPDAGDTLTFSKLGGPDWLSVAPNGTISGTPTTSDIGLNTFTIAVEDQLGQTDTATLLITGHDSDPIVYEGFEGPGGTTLNGFGSGTGWSPASAWTRFSGSTGSASLGAPNTFPGLTTLGQSAALAGGEDLQRDLDLMFTLGAAPGQYQDLWLSFSLDNPGPIAAGHEHRLALRHNGSDILSFGKEINARWRLRGGGTYVEFTDNFSSANLGNWFAVIHLAFDGTDTIATAWLAEASDPGLDTGSLATFPRTGSVTIPGPATFNTVAIRSHNTSSARLDEIAIAANYPRLTSMADDPDNDSTPNYADPDDDGDGIVDSWEAARHLDPLVDDAALNPDRDPFTNLQEYIADTSPHDPDDHPRIDFLTIQPGNLLQISFPTSGARLYQIEYSNNLTPPWLPLVPAAPGTGDTMSEPDPDAANHLERFYRLRITLP